MPLAPQSKSIKLYLPVEYIFQLLQLSLVYDKTNKLSSPKPIQQKALRLPAGESFNAHTEPLFKEKIWVAAVTNILPRNPY